jgi:MoaA/NifB/PqqE/SkfB family radical SAM enzyme/pimeloyl-ACP methyl ester carboxylesterase
VRLGIVLIHGYTGSPEDLLHLSSRLSADHGADSVNTVLLSGHDTAWVPFFDHRLFLDQISLAVERCRKEEREIILIGHSTGGILALSFLKEKGFPPALVILASVPRKIDTAYLQRWEKHRSGMKEVPFHSLASMISVINSVGREASGAYPVLIVHGEKDELVSPRDAEEWKRMFDGQVRSVIVPSAGHDIFRGAQTALAVDVVARSVRDVTFVLSGEENNAVSRLSLAEPEADNFLSSSGHSSGHLVRCPSGKKFMGEKPGPQPFADIEPVFANVEVTTRCNLRCRYCSRSFFGRQGRDMPAEVFERILDLLPHAYRITLVGLGEPLLHPEIVDFVAAASGRGRRVALVTNAMGLDGPLSLELIRAGLHSIAFSIDGADQEMAAEVREGTDLRKVIANIRQFMKISASTRYIPTAVFSAVSARTLAKLPQLIDTVADLGVNVLMMTDLNFAQNVPATLWKNIDERGKETLRKAVSYAFSRELPVLSVHGLEEFGLAERYKDFLLLPPDTLYSRSRERTWCDSPWQTVPVDVQGNVTVCDCQPEKVIGNLLDMPLSEIWNSEMMVEHRRNMLGVSPPKACSICPRF